MTRQFLVDINPNMELPKYELILYSLTGLPITSLKNITNFNYKAFFIGIDEISFNIPAYRSENDGRKVKNEIYDLVDGEYYILLNDKKYFIIDEINEKADDDGNTYKEVHAYSREYELSQKKLVDYKADSRVLYDSSNTMLDGLEKGVLNYIFNHITKSWSIGDVDADIILKDVHRALDFPNTNLIQVFQELQKTFNCIFKFDTINQKIDIVEMDPTKIGQNQGLYISNGNFIKSLSKNIKYDEVKTRLFVYGKDNVSIQSISPTGQPFLDNFDAFKNTKFMTQGLIDALDAYQIKVENYNPNFEPLLTQLQQANQVMEDLINSDHPSDLNLKGLVALERALSIVQTQIDVKVEELAIIKKSIESATGTDLENMYADMRSIQSAIEMYDTEKANINALIKNKRDEINNQQIIIDGIKQQISDLQYALNMNNPLNFTTEQLKELDKFIRVETYNNTNYTEHNITELYEEGKKILARISQPKIQFDVDVVDFLSVVECQHVWKKFVLGDIVTLEHRELGFDYEVRLVGYEHDYENNRLNLKFSNTYTFDDDTLWMRDLLEEINTTATAVDFNKYKWDKTDSIESNIAKMVDAKLEEARQSILSAVGQRYLFDDSGLWLYKENPDGSINPEQIRAINNTIALTKDNWNTVGTAITPQGVVAEQIYGKLGNFARVNAEQIIVDNWIGDPVENNFKDYVDQIKEDTDNINNTVDHIISDGFITNIEANSLKTSFENIKKEAQNIIAIADENGLSTSVERTNCYDALFGVNGLQPEINKWVGRNDYPVEITEDDRNNIINKFRILQDTMMALAEKIRYTREEGLKNGIRTEFRAADGEIIGRVEQIESNMEDISPHNIILSNENQSFVTDSTGKVLNTTTITTNIDTFKGTVRLGAIIGTPLLKNSSGATINYGTITKTNPTAVSSGSVIWTIPANTNVSDDSGWIEIPINIEGSNYVKKLHWNKAKSGRDGIIGSDAYTIILTNESQNFGANSSGNITSPITVTTDVIAYKGTAPITPTIGTLPTVAGLTLSKSGATITITAKTGSALASNGQFNIPIVVDGKSFTKTFSWTKVNAGADGTGVNAKTVSLTGAQVFKYEGDRVEPNSITFTATPQNTVGNTFKWEYSTDGGDTFDTIPEQSNSTYTLVHNSSIWGNSNSIVLKVTIDGVFDTITAYKVRDGSDGENARLVDIIPSNVYFIKDLNGITPDEITLTPEFQNTSYQKWEYSINGTTWTAITRTTSSTTLPWMNSSTRVLTIPKGWSVLNNNDYVVFRVTTTTGEMDVQTISILYDVSELESRVTSAEQKITPEAIIQTVEQQVSQGDTTIAQKSDITQTVDNYMLKFDYLKTSMPFRYIRSSLREPSVGIIGWTELEVYKNGVNIARGKPVTASKVLSSGTASMYTDGNNNVADSSNFVIMNVSPTGYGWLKVDLGSVVSDIDSIIDYIPLVGQYDYKLEVSSDDVNWTTIFDGRRPAGSQINSFPLKGIQQGITTISANGIRVEHSDMPGQYSEIRADGFIRKWQYGEAAYLNDIWIQRYNFEGDTSSSPIAYTLDIPVRFRDRDVEVFLVPCVTNAPYKFADPSFQIVNEVVVYVSGKRGIYTNVPQPYVEVHAYTVQIVDGERIFNGLAFDMIVIGK